MVPNQESFLAWLADPTTQWVLRELPRLKINGMKDRWASGEFTAPTAEATMQLNATAIAETKVWEWWSELSYEDIQTETDDGTKQR